MIGWEDVYKVVGATAPLYVALMLGYCSVKWWRLFVTPEQCDAINRLVCYFTLPLFAFEFTAHVDPFDMNYMFMAADVISKLLIVLVMACWYGSSKFTAARAGKLHDGKEVKHDNFGWSITIFSLSNLTNSLVVGVPLLRAMYGQMAVDLVVQSSVFQALIWLTLLLFVLEVRRTCGSKDSIQFNPDVSNAAPSSENINSNNTKDVNALNCELEDPTTNRISSDTTAGEVRESININGRLSNFWALTKVVWLKLAMNPNSYACIIGIAWAFLSNRWHMEMPSIMEGSVLIMSRAGTGTAMFSMGLFMASQEKVIACGASLTVFGMVLRFIAGPLAMAIASLAVGLRGDVLRVAIIQAALPQSITSFIYAKEYGLHPDVLSSAVIFGMIVSLPVLVGYYAVLEFAH